MSEGTIVRAPAATGRFLPPDLSGAVAVVTGAGQGIGAAIARALAASGARVVIDGRHAETIEAVCAEIRATGAESACLRGSVTDPDHLGKLMELAAGPGGVVDVLVNNASIAGPTAPLAEVSLEEWNETVAVNLTGVFLACRAALPYLGRSQRGRIVNIGSATGKRPLLNRSPYAAAKIGVVGLTRTLAHEVGPLGISVNTISPWCVGGKRLETVITSMAKERGLDPDELVAELTADMVFKRPVSEEDIANLTLFLCSSAAGDITGQDLNVSAGGVMY